MLNTEYIRLRNGSKVTTFVTRNRKELRELVRSYLVQAVTTYYSEEGSHALDGKIGIRVAMDYNIKYASHVRVAMSHCKNVVWSVSKSGVIEYDKSAVTTRKELGEVLTVLCESLDEIDNHTVSLEVTPEQRLNQMGKSFNTRLLNLTSEQISAISCNLDDRSTDQLHNLSDVVTTLSIALAARLKVEAVA